MSDLPDLSTYDNDRLDRLRRAVLIEGEDRHAAEAIPGQIEALSARYLRATGQGQPPVDAAERGVGRSEPTQNTEGTP